MGMVARRTWEQWRREELRALAERLLGDDPDAVEECLSFFEAETRGLWHNRARALIARRLKHWQLSPAQQARVVATVRRRLTTGTFTEQFKDQLRLAILLDRTSVIVTAKACMNSPKEYIRRYANWLLERYAEPDSPSRLGPQSE